MPAALVLTQVWYRSIHGASPMLCSALPCGVARPPLTGPALTSRRPAPPPLCCPRDGERGTGETSIPLPNWLIPLPKHVAISGTLLGGIGSVPDANAYQQFLCNGQEILSTPTTSGSSREECVSLGRIRAGRAGRDKSPAHGTWNGMGERPQLEGPRDDET